MRERDHFIRSTYKVSHGTDFQSWVATSSLWTSIGVSYGRLRKISKWYSIWIIDWHKTYLAVQVRIAAVHCIFLTLWICSPQNPSCSAPCAWSWTSSPLADWDTSSGPGSLALELIILNNGRKYDISCTEWAYLFLHLWSWFLWLKPDYLTFNVHLHTHWLNPNSALVFRLIFHLNFLNFLVFTLHTYVPTCPTNTAFEPAYSQLF